MNFNSALLLTLTAVDVALIGARGDWCRPTDRAGPRQRSSEGARATAGPVQRQQPRVVAPPAVRSSSRDAAATAATASSRTRPASPASGGRQRGISAERSGAAERPSRGFTPTRDAAAANAASVARRAPSPATAAARAASPAPSSARGRSAERPKPVDDVVYKPPFDLWSRPESPARLRSSMPVRAWRSTVSPSPSRGGSSMHQHASAVLTSPQSPQGSQQEQRQELQTPPPQRRLRSSSASRVQFLQLSIDLSGTGSGVNRNPVVDISPSVVDPDSASVAASRRSSSASRYRAWTPPAPQQQQQHRDDVSDMHSMISRSSCGSRRMGSTTPSRRESWNRSTRPAEIHTPPREPAMDIRRLYRDVVHSARASPQTSTNSASQQQQQQLTPNVLKSADGFSNWYSKSGL